MFKRISGRPNIEWIPKAASQVFTNGGLTYWNGSGYLIPADATSGDHAGVILRTVAATDADYAVTGAKVPVDVPGPNDIFEVDVETGTLTVAMVGEKRDLVADGDAVNVNGTSKNVVLIVGFISASKALVKVSSLASSLRVATT